MQAQRSGRAGGVLAVTCRRRPRAHGRPRRRDRRAGHPGGLLVAHRRRRRRAGSRPRSRGRRTPWPPCRSTRRSGRRTARRRSSPRRGGPRRPRGIAACRAGAARPSRRWRVEQAERQGAGRGRGDQAPVRQHVPRPGKCVTAERGTSAAAAPRARRHASAARPGPRPGGPSPAPGARSRPASVRARTVVRKISRKAIGGLRNPPGRRARSRPGRWRRTGRRRPPSGGSAPPGAGTRRRTYRHSPHSVAVARRRLAA